jgi:photosystem II stability/assembly factor-like uncharacterized protein
MKRTIHMSLSVAVAVLAGTTAFAQKAAQPSSGFPASDTAYKSTFIPKLPTPGADVEAEDSAQARREWTKELMGGDPSPQFVQALLDAARAERERYPNAFATGVAGSWTNIGPVRSNWIQNGPVVTASDTGRLRTILVHPSNPDIVYVLTSGGGLWKTSNFLAPRPDWAVKTDTVLGVAGGAVAFGGNSNTLYLGSGDPFDGGVGGFVTKSTNGGDSWQRSVKVGGATTVMDVKVDSTSATDVVLVATNAGLFRSVDAGATYQASGVVNKGAYLAWSLAQTAGAWLVTVQQADGSGGIYRSTDRGATWKPVSVGTTNVGRITLAVGEAGDPVVYAFAATAGDGAQKDLFRSSDAGQTWTALGLATKKPINPNEDQPDMNIMEDQAFYNQMVLVDPTDTTRNTVYIGGQLSSAKSTDGGRTWRVISNWLAQFKLPYVHADFHAAAFVPQTKTILFGSDGGLFVSTDGGATFSTQKNDGIGSYLIYALATNEKNANNMIIGLQDNGTRVRVGTSDTFNQVFGGDGFGVGWSDGYSLGSIYYSFIIRNPNGQPATQQKWQVGWNGIDSKEFFNPAATQFFTTIYQPSPAASPDRQTYFHRTKRTLYETTDAAALWKPIFRLPAGVSGEFRAVMHGIGTGYDNLNEIAVSVSASRVAISLDGGKTFTIKSLAAVPGMAAGFTSAVAWARPGELYLSTENPDPSAAHLIRSLDGGVTWARVDANNGLPPVPIRKLLVSTRDASRKTIYAGTWLGVYESTDAGATWHRFGTGLPLAIINDLYMPSDGSFLRAASYGRGIWDFRF